MNNNEFPGDGRSILWAEIAPMVSLASNSLENFRSERGVNSRLAHYAPSEPTLRWFRSFVHLAASTTPPRQVEILEIVGDTSLGRPVTATVNCPHPNLESHYRKADLDYLYAAEEVSFLESALDLQLIQTVVELGAGFGRTAKTLLSVAPSIGHYLIIDLPETLKLSSAYLRQVLAPDEFDKLRFLTPDEISSLENCIDLLIQIDGFQEMDNEIINRIYTDLVPLSTWFYSSNPIGKYLPESAGLAGVDPDLVETVMTLGRSKSIVDPWDCETLDPVRGQHADAYRPLDFKTLTSTPSRLRPLYQHVIYESKIR